jgi:hypothetical protein
LTLVSPAWRCENAGMSPAIEPIASIAAVARAKFADGRRMRFGNSNAVHAVELRRWKAGELLPGPSCHIGSFSAPEDAQATWAPITCGRCIRKHATRDEILPRGFLQPPLFHVAA